MLQWNCLWFHSWEIAVEKGTLFVLYWICESVFLVKPTEKRPILSCRSSTSFTSTHVFLFVGVCHAPASMPRPGRQGRTLLANCRQSGHVNSPLSTEKPWRTWSFWGGTKDNFDWICLIAQFLRMWLHIFTLHYISTWTKSSPKLLYYFII